ETDDWHRTRSRSRGFPQIETANSAGPSVGREREPRSAGIDAGPLLADRRIDRRADVPRWRPCVGERCAVGHPEIESAEALGPMGTQDDFQSSGVDHWELVVLRTAQFRHHRGRRELTVAL